MGKRWTAELDSALITMRGAGMTHQEIGSIMGRSQLSCSQRAFQLGITKKHSGPLPIDLPVYETDAPADADVDSIAFNLGRPQHEPTLLERMFSKLLGRK